MNTCGGRGVIGRWVAIGRCKEQRSGYQQHVEVAMQLIHLDEDLCNWQLRATESGHQAVFNNGR
jgi:hypothetical protein